MKTYSMIALLILGVQYVAAEGSKPLVRAIEHTDLPRVKKILEKGLALKGEEINVYQQVAKNSVDEWERNLNPSLRDLPKIGVGILCASTGLGALTIGTTSIVLNYGREDWDRKGSRLFRRNTGPRNEKIALVAGALLTYLGAFLLYNNHHATALAKLAVAKKISKEINSLQASEEK